MSTTAVRGEIGQVALARGYLGAQAVAGALWWVGVAVSEPIRTWTLGGWDARLLAVPDLVLFVGGSVLAAVRENWRVAAVTTVWTVGLTVALTSYGLLERAAGWGVILMALASVGTVAATMTLRAGRMPTAWYFVGPFRFRPAAARSRARNLATSLAQLAVFWGSFFVVVPWLLRMLEDRLQVSWPALASEPWPTLGIVVFALASPLGLWSCVTMAVAGEGTPLPVQTARRLVVAGPYRWIRNPMATAGVLQSIGMALWFGTWTVVLIAIAGAVAWHVGIRPVEEADLAARFGEPYERYRAAVRCWVPRVGR